MATTAGALALKDNVTGRNSPLVAGLRNAGAVILDKTNLSQWANFRSENSMSGWSALGGQVRNSHMLDRNPCGSSAGSGAAMVLDAMATGAAKTDYSKSLDAGSLQGIRVGALCFAKGSNRYVKVRFKAALSAMKAAGAELVEIEEFEPEGETYNADTYDVLKNGFKHTLNECLAATPPSVETRTLAGLIAFNNEHADIELALFD